MVWEGRFEDFSDLKFSPGVNFWIYTCTNYFTHISLGAEPVPLKPWRWEAPTPVRSKAE